MNVLILAAGYGTRLYPLTLDTPKALLPLNKRPLVNYLLDKLKNINDIAEVIVVSNDKFYPHFTQWAANDAEYTQSITVVNDGTKTPDDRLGSIGDIDFVLKGHTSPDDLLVLGGDNLFDFNIEEYVRFAKGKSPAATVGLYDLGERESAKKFGVVALDENSKVVSFEEKPNEPKSSLISMCLYYFPKESLEYITRYVNESASTDTAGGYIKWLSSCSEVYGFSFTGTWYDIGSKEAYEQAQKDFT